MIHTFLLLEEATCGAGARSRSGTSAVGVGLAGLGAGLGDSFHGSRVLSLLGVVACLFKIVSMRTKLQGVDLRVPELRTRTADEHEQQGRDGRNYRGGRRGSVAVKTEVSIE